MWSNNKWERRVLKGNLESAILIECQNKGVEGEEYQTSIFIINSEFKTHTWITTKRTRKNYRWWTSSYFYLFSLLIKVQKKRRAWKITVIILKLKREKTQSWRKFVEKREDYAKKVDATWKQHLSAHSRLLWLGCCSAAL